mmetsp:Transcript_25463/g.87827  ORF Transcript_25463/g.87827 Transcript_25463/m.87827 type:complete len:210 (-) Transcript_25463:21-650(-)
MGRLGRDDAGPKNVPQVALAPEQPRPLHARDRPSEQAQRQSVPGRGRHARGPGHALVPIRRRATSHCLLRGSPPPRKSSFCLYICPVCGHALRPRCGAVWSAFAPHGQGAGVALSARVGGGEDPARVRGRHQIAFEAPKAADETPRATKRRPMIYEQKSITATPLEALSRKTPTAPTKTGSGATLHAASRGENRPAIAWLSEFQLVTKS